MTTRRISFSVPTTRRADPATPADPVAVCAQRLESAADELLAELKQDRAMSPAALSALRRAVAVLEESTGRTGDAMHVLSLDQDSSLWDRAAVDLYNAVSGLHESQALLASAQHWLERALHEDAQQADLH